MKKIIARLKELYQRWQTVCFAFCKHPIQYTKDYFRDFKQLPKKDKLIKILWAAAFVFATVYAFWFVVCMFAAFIICGALCASGGIELERVRRAQWMVTEYGGKEADYL